MTTKFQEVLAPLRFSKYNRSSAEWARSVEDALNNAGLKVVDAYDDVAWPEES